MSRYMNVYKMLNKLFSIKNSFYLMSLLILLFRVLSLIKLKNLNQYFWSILTFCISGIFINGLMIFLSTKNKILLRNKYFEVVIILFSFISHILITFEIEDDNDNIEFLVKGIEITYIISLILEKFKTFLFKILFLIFLCLYLLIRFRIYDDHYSKNYPSIIIIITYISLYNLFDFLKENRSKKGKIPKILESNEKKKNIIPKFDETDNKVITETLTSKNHHSIILESINQGIIYFDNLYEIIYANEFICNFFATSNYDELKLIILNLEEEKENFDHSNDLKRLESEDFDELRKFFTRKLSSFITDKELNKTVNENRKISFLSEKYKTKTLFESRSNFDIDLLNLISPGLKFEKAYHLNLNDSFNFKLDGENPKDLKSSKKKIKTIEYYLTRIFKNLDFESIVKQSKNIKNIETKNYQFMANYNTKILKIFIIPCNNNENGILLIEEIENNEQKKNKSGKGGKHRFLNTLCHELRTPINCLTNMLEMIQQNIIEEGIRIYATNALYSSKMLLSCINDFLDYFALTTNLFSINFQVFDLEKTMIECVKIFEFFCFSKGIEFHFEFDNSINQKIKNDEKRLTQILFNLFNNAIRHTEKGHIILKVAKKSNKTIQIQISDTGCGIPKDNLNYLGNFNKINKKDSEEKTAGFGLYISNCLANLLILDDDQTNQTQKGIFVTSQQNIGSKFFFSIEDIETVESCASIHLKMDEFNKTHSFDTEALFLKSTSECIRNNQIFLSIKTDEKCDCPKAFIVDDNYYNISIIKQFLKNKKVESTSASNGLEAIKHIKKVLKGKIKIFCEKCVFYQCILMDIDMPLLGGIEATMQLKLIFKYYSMNIPIIAISAFTSEDIKVKAINSGMIAYYEKPVTVKHIDEIIKTYIKF